MNELVIGETDDEWYDRSITDYSELMMLELENTPLQLSVGDADSLFLLEQKNEKTQVLSYQALPDKIVDSRRNDVVKSSHMKIRAGAFLSQQLKQIHAIYGRQTVLASEVNSPGLSVFKIPTGSDKIWKEIKRIGEATQYLEPHFCLMDNETIIVSKTVNDDVYLCNIVTNLPQKLHVAEFTSCPFHPNLMPFAISRDLVAFGCENTGHTAIYDLRIHSHVMTLHAKQPSSKYCFTASYNAIPPQSQSNLVCMASNLGSALVFDLRSLKLLPCVKVAETVNKICLSPNEVYFSTSDKKGVVQIYSTSEGVSEKFSHKGHVRMEHCNRTAECTDHLWFSQSTLISSASNKTLNIWQPNFSS